MWLTVPVKTWDEYAGFVGMFTRGKYIYRGQSNIKWGLESSFLRECKKVEQFVRNIGLESKMNRLRYEATLLREFESSYSLYTNHKIDSTIDDLVDFSNKQLETWALMQHHGTPTRLLDWTYSPYIAAFFALDGADDDFCVFAIQHEKLDQHLRSEIGEDCYGQRQDLKTNHMDGLYVSKFDPEYKSQRLRMQQGLFLVPNRNDVTFDEIFASYGLKQGKLREHGEIVAYKFVFPKKQILACWDILMRMNITHETIYPGLDGFSKSLKLRLMDIDHMELFNRQDK